MCFQNLVLQEFSVLGVNCNCQTQGHFFYLKNIKKKNSSILKYCILYKIKETEKSKNLVKNSNFYNV